MKTITSLRDLEQYGIIPLTGEADALSFRILCDLTRQGVAVVREAYGLEAPFNESGKVEYPGFASAWNNGTTSCPHVASILLAHDAWFTLGIIALLTAGECHTVVSAALRTDRSILYGLYGFGKHEAFREAQWEFDKAIDNYKIVKPPYFTHEGAGEDWIEFSENLHGKVQRVFKNPSGPQSQGLRNIHQMSGRVT